MRSASPRRRRPLQPLPARRGVFLLPSLLTVGNILCGFSSMVSAARGEFEHAAILLLLAALLDTLDGRVARLTRTTSAFGVQFDSLSDVVSFGVAPSFLVYWWGMEPLGRVGWAASFLFVTCGAMRLARFNIQSPAHDKRFFVGLPIPAAALVVAAIVFYRPERVVDRPLAYGVMALVLVLAALMVSRLRYWSFKSGQPAGGYRSFLTVALLAAVLALAAIEPALALLGLTLLYMVSGLTPRWRGQQGRRTMSWRDPAPTPGPGTPTGSPGGPRAGEL